MNTNSKVLFISHGGGPLPLLGDPGHREMVAVLRELGDKLAKPQAILVVSAHWETDILGITSAANPVLIYDYYGFPEESYTIQYPAPGSPTLAEQVQERLGRAGLVATLDGRRGFDHGLFVPLKLMYPEADIPCVQISLLKGLDPGRHILFGEALKDLPAEGVLIVGSGFSFHNLNAFFSPPSPEMLAMNQAFEHWLIDTCANPDYSETERAQRLIRWDEMPAARFCHPREEHLLPLHVCYGAAGAPAQQVFQFNVMGWQASAFCW